jgi:hypothetical protein
MLMFIFVTAVFVRFAWHATRFLRLLLWLLWPLRLLLRLVWSLFWPVVVIVIIVTVHRNPSCPTKLYA